MAYQKVILPLVLLFLIASAHADITIKVVNQNRNYANTNTYVRFECDPNQLNATLNGTPVAPRISYSLDQMTNGINLSSYQGGRIFFSFGNPLNDSRPPEPNNSSIPSYFTRFDKIELTYSSNTNDVSVANLTTVDFFAIPLSLKTYKNGALVQTLGCSVDGNTMIRNLSDLTQNNTNVVLSDTNGNFLRVLSPSNDDAYQYYPSMQGYINSVRESGVPITIEDHYSQNGGTTATQTQNYSFSGTFDENDNLMLVGGGDLVGTNHVIRFSHDELLKGIYACNPSYLVDATASSIGENNVYSAVVRDVVAGFNLGFVGSSTINPTTGIAFGGSSSCDWWNSSRAFSFLQPTNPFYSQWTKYVYEDSDAYGFPFSDRWQKVLIPLDSDKVDTLEITILPDDRSENKVTM